MKRGGGWGGFGRHLKGRLVSRGDVLQAGYLLGESECSQNAIVGNGPRQTACRL